MIMPEQLDNLREIAEPKMNMAINFCSNGYVLQGEVQWMQSGETVATQRDTAIAKTADEVVALVKAYMTENTFDVVLEPDANEFTFAREVEVQQMDTWPNSVKQHFETQQAAAQRFADENLSTAKSRVEFVQSYDPDADIPGAGNCRSDDPQVG